jgi:hypothetical protein
MPHQPNTGARPAGRPLDDQVVARDSGASLKRVLDLVMARAADPNIPRDLVWYEVENGQAKLWFRRRQP